MGRVLAYHRINSFCDPSVLTVNTNVKFVRFDRFSYEPPARDGRAYEPAR